MHVMFSSRHQKFTCVYDVITIFYQQEHRSSFFLILPLPPLIFPFFFATLTKPAEANPSCRVAPNGFDPVSLSLSLSFSRFRISAGFRTAAAAADAEAEAEAAAVRRTTTRRRYNRIVRRLPAREARRARFDKSNTRRDAMRLYSDWSRRSGRARKTERAATKRTYTSLLACLPGCLTPASCLPASFGGEQPAAPTLFVSRVACLHVDSLFTRFPPPPEPRWFAAPSPHAAWHRAVPSPHPIILLLRQCH